jgi:putative DNA methylase
MMVGAFAEAHRVLKSDGQMVVVYAHKTTVGWATLVDALRRSGFAVSEAWPLDTERPGRVISIDTASLTSSIFLVTRKASDNEIASYEEVRPELERVVRERVETLWQMGITGSDLIIAGVGAGLRTFTRFKRIEYANGEEVPAERFLAEVEGVVLETLLEKIFDVPRSGVATVDGPSRFYVLWRYAYKAAELDAGEAIVFTYGQQVELDGQNGLVNGSRSLVEKKQGKYRLRDYTERGYDEKLGLLEEGPHLPTSLIDVLHRILWLMEHEPRNLGKYLEGARPDRERLRLIAQALAGPGLKGTSDGTSGVVTTTVTEQATLNKLLANWRVLIEQRLAASEGTLFGMGTGRGAL